MWCAARKLIFLFISIVLDGFHIAFMILISSFRFNVIFIFWNIHRIFKQHQWMANGQNRQWHLLGSQVPRLNLTCLSLAYCQHGNLFSPITSTVRNGYSREHILYSPNLTRLNDSLSLRYFIHPNPLIESICLSFSCVLQSFSSTPSIDKSPRTKDGARRGSQ